MKLWIWSDVHSELQDVPYPTREQAPDCDVIIIAGDLTIAPDLPCMVEFLIRRHEKPIIYVAGNHEFYQDKWLLSDRYRSMESDRRIIKAIETLSVNWPSRFYCLDEDELIIGSTRFLGATLWVDFQMNLAAQSDLPRHMHEAREVLNDFRAIHMGDRKRFKPDDMLNLHNSNADYIRRKLSEPFDGSTVVITHHMPHPECTPAAYAGMKANYLFASSDDAFGRLLHSDIAPELWICGHTHHAFDISIGRTRVVCNPFGYKWEQGRNGFQWKLVIEAVTERENE